MRLAGIDIGTLTCRLLVADVNLPHQFKEIDADRRILRLGEGVGPAQTAIRLKPWIEWWRRSKNGENKRQNMT